MDTLIKSTAQKYKKFIRNTITRDVLFTLVNFVWKIISGPLTLLLISMLLTPQFQGYWYTFGSLAALGVFADLGFTTIVSQFSAHEFAFLEFNEHGRLTGDSLHIMRLGSLLRYVIKWATSVTIIAFPIIIVVGLVVFTKRNEINGWILPWVLYIISSGLSFIVGTCLSFYEGCNQIASIQKNKLLGTIVATLLTWILLFFNFGLYILFISDTIRIMIYIVLLYKNYKTSIIQLFLESKGFIYNWSKEVLKLIWKYAISFSSSYLIFQIYTPLAFQFNGSIYAGKVGISMSLCSALVAIANVWMYTATPKLNMSASKKDWLTMDRLLNKNLIMSICTYIFGAIIIVLLLIFFKSKLTMLDRFLKVTPMIILLTAWLLQIIINGLSIYLRAHKEEPFMLLSLISAIYISISTYFLVKHLNVDLMFVGFLTSYSLTLPWALFVFIKKRKQWHESKEICI